MTNGDAPVGDPGAPPPTGERRYGRRPEDQPVLRDQRKYSRAAFWAGTIALGVTTLFPVAGELVDFFVAATGWGCETVAVGDCETVCQGLGLASPWPLWAGLAASTGLYLASAAFAQVAVGGIGVGWLKMLKPGGD